MRITRPHHPLYLERLAVAEFWAARRGRWLVVVLPDGSHIRIPASWADDGEGPTMEDAGTTLTATSAKELIARLRSLRGGA